MNEDQLSALATHLYVRLRRDGGRVIDVIWMTRNQDYAREVIRLARGIPDAEVARLADRFEELMFGVVHAAASLAPSAPAPRHPLEDTQTPAPSVAGRYRGGLR